MPTPDISIPAHRTQLGSLVRSMTRRDWIAAFALAAVLAICGVFGASYVAGEGTPVLDEAATIALIFLFTFVFVALLILGDLLFERLAQLRESPRTPNDQQPSLLERLTPRWSRRSILIFAAIMGLFWLPWFIANLPGTTYWDTYYQIFQVYPENHPIAIIPWSDIYQQTLTDAWLVDHHPVLTTLIYGAFGWTSDQLAGNWMAGVFLFVCLQGAASLIAFTTACAYLRRIGTPLAVVLATYLFFAIMPFVSTWALCMVKDSLFSLFFIGYFLMLVETVRTHGALLVRPRNLVLFCLSALMLCLTKKTGLFIVIPTAIFLAFNLRNANAKEHVKSEGESVAGDVDTKQGECEQARTYEDLSVPDGCNNENESGSAKVRRCTDKDSGSARIRRCAPVRTQLVLSCEPNEAPTPPKHFSTLRALAPAIVSILIAGLLLPLVIFPAANIAPGGRQEVLGPLFQQTARYVVDHGNEVSNEERAAIAQVLDYDKLASAYKYDFEDSVKYRYNLDATPDDIIAYLQVYVAQGMRHPESYAAAFWSLAGFYVAPTAFINIRMVTVDTKMGPEKRYMLWNPDELDGLRNGMSDAYKAIASVPILDIPLLIVTYVMWLPAFALYCLWRRHLRAGVLFVPIMVLIAFCIIAPVYDARYVIPIFDTVPILFGMLLAFAKTKGTGVVRLCPSPSVPSCVDSCTVGDGPPPSP